MSRMKNTTVKVEQFHLAAPIQVTPRILAETCA
jgi:hypothetical protein